VISSQEATEFLKSIDTAHVVGLRDRALIAVMVLHLRARLSRGRLSAKFLVAGAVDTTETLDDAHRVPVQQRFGVDPTVVSPGRTKLILRGAASIPPNLLLLKHRMRTPPA
jgi:hypothetical protein